MKSKSIAQLLLALVLVGVAAVLLSRTFARPRIDFGPYQALGTVAAEEALALCGGVGRIVLVIPDPGTDPDPVLESQVAAFKQALKSRSGVELAAVEKITMDPFRRMQTGGAIPLEDFETIRQRHGSAAAIVLFIGCPPNVSGDGDGDGGGGGKTSPKVMVVSAALPGYDLLLRQGILDVAIVPRPMSVEEPTTPAANLREAFDREYLILRREE